MVLVGAQKENKGAMFLHHHKKFNIDEDALTIGKFFIANLHWIS